jgi:peptide/nickel transport system permease protein
MHVWLLKRIAYSLLTLLAISVIVFSLVRLTGDPVLLFLPPDAPTAEVDRLRRALGFEDPLPVQYARFLRSALAGDVGFSLKHQEPALRVVLDRLPATLELATAAMLLTLAIALPAGIVSAVRRNSWLDRLVMAGVVVGQSMPTYWIGIMLAHLVMPSVTLALFFTARIARLTRSGMLNVLRTDYVRTARAKGLAMPVVVLKHALRNAALPIVTIVGIEFGTLLGGTVITETVFAWPGLGRLAVDAIFARDYPVVQTIVLLVSTLFVSINLVVDLLYRVIDPRVELA